MTLYHIQYDYICESGTLKETHHFIQMRLLHKIKGHARDVNNEFHASAEVFDPPCSL